MKWQKLKINRSTIEKYLSFLILATFACIIGLTVYWQAFDTGNIAHWQDVPGHKQTVGVGDKLQIYRQFCIDRTVDIHIKREIRDGITYHLPEDNKLYKAGCYYLALEWTIPAALPPGYYVYDTVVSYDINPLRTKQDRLQPFFFIVKNPDGTIPQFQDEAIKNLINSSAELDNLPQQTFKEGFQYESIQIR